MSPSSTRHGAPDRSSPWAAGASAFAASMLVVTGVLQLLQGLIGVVDGDDFLVRTGDYIFAFDATIWGWIHLLLGAALVAAGLAIFAGNLLGRAVGIAIAGVSAVANFLWIPYFPVWAIVIIALDVFVIWGLTTSDLGRR